MNNTDDVEKLLAEKNALNVQMSAFADKRKKAQDQIASIAKERTKADEQIRLIAKKISKIDIRISELVNCKKPKKVVITDHAILRYLERIHGFNTDEVKSTLLTEKLRENIQEFKTGKITENGVTYVFKDQTVVTIMST